MYQEMFGETCDVCGKEIGRQEDQTLFCVDACKDCSSAWSQYAALQEVYLRAFRQVMVGKGKERHTDPRCGDLPFQEQMCVTTRQVVGRGFTIGQAIKKASEVVSPGLQDRPRAQVRELLGAMNYLAAEIICIMQDHDVDVIHGLCAWLDGKEGE
jgi:hypothetical protein